MEPQYDQVCLLLQTPFSKWKESDKREIILSPKPTPTLPLEGLFPNGKHKNYFQCSWYINFPWLCGSHYFKKLFCWPCVIFGTKKNGVWNRTGFDSIMNPTRLFKFHEGTVEHLKNSLQFSNFNKSLKQVNYVLQENSRLYIANYNKKVILNRQFMQIPLRALLFLIKQKLPFTMRNSNNFKELIKVVLKETSAEMQQHYLLIQEAFDNNILSIQNELIHCIYVHLNECIKNEILESSFFAVEVNDTKDISYSSQCSITIRYVSSDGLLVERFLGFHDVGDNHTSDALATVIETALSPLCHQIKLIAQAYDGGCVIQEELFKLQNKIKADALQVLFTYSSAHRFDIVIKQCLNDIAECRIFFSILSDIPSFFYHLKDIPYVSKFILSKKIPINRDIRWSPNSKILRLVADEWTVFKVILKKILADPNIDQISIQHANGFLGYFNDFGFTLLALIFDVIFQLTDILYDTLLKRNMDISYCLQQIEETQKIISEQRNSETFERFFGIAETKTVMVLKNTCGYRTKAEVLETFKALYFGILDTIIMQLEMRFIDTERLQFFSLGDPTKFEELLKIPPDKIIDALEKTYPNIIKNPSRLKNELRIIYEDPSYRTYTLEQIVKKMHDDDSKSVLQEAYKLYCLILTIPWNSSEVANLNCLKRIENYFQHSTLEKKQELATISIELEMIDQLINKTPFYADIIERFASLKEHNIELNLKK